MSRRTKRCTVALADVVFDGTGAAVTATWKDPDTIAAAAPTAMELEYVPALLTPSRIVKGAAPADPALSATVTGVTVTPGNATDTGTIRVKGETAVSER